MNDHEIAVQQIAIDLAECRKPLSDIQGQPDFHRAAGIIGQARALTLASNAYRERAIELAEELALMVEGVEDE